MHLTPAELEAQIREEWDEIPRWVRILFWFQKESIISNATSGAIRKQQQREKA